MIKFHVALQQSKTCRPRFAFRCEKVDLLFLAFCSMRLMWYGKMANDNCFSSRQAVICYSVVLLWRILFPHGRLEKVALQVNKLSQHELHRYNACSNINLINSLHTHKVYVHFKTYFLDTPFRLISTFF